MEKTIRTEIAKAIQASLQGMEIFLNNFVVLNFFTKSSAKYQLTPLAEKFPTSLRAVSPTMLLAAKKAEGG